MQLPTRIFIGLAAGAAFGVAANLLTHGGPTRFIELVTEPIGKMWLSALIMVVIPMVISTLATGVAQLGSFKRLGRIGLITIVCFLSLTLLSSILGISIMNIVAPGVDLDPAIRTKLLETYRGQTTDAMGMSSTTFSIDLLVKIIPRNPVAAAASGDMLAVIFFALMIGVALLMIPEEKGAPVRNFLDSVAHISIATIDLIMRVAPIGVFALIFSVTARFGFDLLLNLAHFIVAVIAGLVIFLVVGYSLALLLVARVSPRTFFSRARIVMITAFSTSSSNATLPTTIRVAEQSMGISPSIAGFVLPLGATVNMNGTALYEGATVLFLAQVFGIKLTLAAQVIVVLMSVLTSIGVAGIPGASLPFIMVVLGMVGVPLEGIAIIMGIDRLLDMCRTVLNVMGDLVTATIVSRFEPGPAVAPVSVTTSVPSQKNLG